MADSSDPARAYLPPAALRSAYSIAKDPIPIANLDRIMSNINTMSQHSAGESSGLDSPFGAPESPFGAPESPFGAPESPFGAPESPYVSPYVSPHQSPPKMSPHQSPPKMSPHQSPPKMSPHQSPPKMSPQQSPPKISPPKMSPSSPSERPGRKKHSPGSYSSLGSSHSGQSGHSEQSSKRTSPKDGKRKEQGRGWPRERPQRKKGERTYGQAANETDEADTTWKGHEEELEEENEEEQSIRTGSPGSELPSAAAGKLTGSGIFFTPFDSQRDDEFPSGLVDHCSVYTMGKDEENEDEDEDEGIFDLSESRYLKENVGTAFALGMAEIMTNKPSDPIQYLGHFLYRWNYNQEAKLASKRKFDKIRRGCERDALKEDLKF